MALRGWDLQLGQVVEMGPPALDHGHAANEQPQGHNVPLRVDLEEVPNSTWKTPLTRSTIWRVCGTGTTTRQRREQAAWRCEDPWKLLRNVHGGELVIPVLKDPSWAWSYPFGESVDVIQRQETALGFFTRLLSLSALRGVTVWLLDRHSRLPADLCG
ncbi:hypothetical protein ACHAPE_009044 [Trichoderma viride]